MLTLGNSAAVIHSQALYDLLGEMGSTIELKDLVRKILHTEAQPGHTEYLAQCLDLGFAHGARLALERHLFGPVPGDVLAQTIGKLGELLRRQEAGRAAAKVDKAKRSLAHHGQLADHRNLAAQRIDVTLRPRPR